MNRVITPTILQLEMTECGAASLGMVLAYHGLRVPLEQLRIACGVSRDGSRASNVLNAARKLGLLAKGFKKEPEELPSVRPPMIVFWNFNHFLVVEGFGKNKVYLNDPAMGRRAVTDVEFNESFTGIVLTFEKGPGFKTGGRSRSPFRSLVRRLRGSYSGLLYAVLATLCLAIPACLIPVFSRVFIDSVLIHGMTAWLHPLAAAMLGVAALAGALTFLQQDALFRLRRKLAISGSAKFFWHVLRLPAAFYAQRSSGEIGARLAINDRLATLLSGELAASLVNLLLLFCYGALLLQYDVPLTLIAGSALILNLLFLQWVGRRRKDQTLRMQMEQGKLSGISASGLQTIETLKAMGAESDFFARWAGTQAKVVNSKLSLANATVLLSVFPALLIAATNAAVLGLGGLRVMDGTLTIGLLIGYQALMASFLAPVNQLINMGASLAQVGADITQLDDVLLNPPDAQADFVPVNSGERLEGTLEFRGVTFGYSKLEEPLIKDFTLAVKPGQRVALVGGSGSGKSTLAKLAAGLFEPWSGEILLNGQPRHSIPRTVLTNSIALVDQDIVLFRATIRENLTMWEHGLPLADVVEAAKDACIHDDITSRNGGYEHMTEEAARDFSGGQRQRLEIARALAGNPRLLIMDEATSALDAYTEKTIDDNVRRRGCTCLIVAHRLSTVRDCDEIVVLERGVVVERGRHEELIAAQGAYARLIEAH